MVQATTATEYVGLTDDSIAALNAGGGASTVALDAPTLAALEQIVVSGTVALDAPTLAALESITAVVSGSVAVTNLPADYPLPMPQFKAIQRATPDVDQRYEFGVVGTENKPIYIGQAPPASLTSDNLWVIQKYTWAAAPNGTGNVPSLIATRTGSWDNRSLLF